MQRVQHLREPVTEISYALVRDAVVRIDGQANREIAKSGVSIVCPANFCQRRCVIGNSRGFCFFRTSGVQPCGRHVFNLSVAL